MAVRVTPEATAKIALSDLVKVVAHSSTPPPKAAVNHSFTHCCQKGKAGGNGPTGFHLEEEMTETHLNFLARMLVIVIIKVKIIIKKR
jgi:hypothetical protein